MIRAPKPTRLVILAAAALSCGLAGCGGGSHPKPPPATCRHITDSVSVSRPMVEIAPRGVTVQTISAGGQAAMACDTRLTVADGGTAQASFSKQAICQVQQISSESQRSAALLTRDPASALFQLTDGKVTCSFGNAPAGDPMCGIGTVFPGNDSSGLIECAKDPLFEVAVYLGTMRVLDPAGRSYVLTAGQALSYHFGARQSVVTPAAFSAADLGILMAQDTELGLPGSEVSTSSSPSQSPSSPNSGSPSLIAQVVTITSTPPPGEMPGDTYALQATGGGSGSPIIYTTPSSTCSMKNNVAIFSAAGPCEVDATQAGNAQYAPGETSQIIDVQPGPA